MPDRSGAIFQERKKPVPSTPQSSHFEAEVLNIGVLQNDLSFAVLNSSTDYVTSVLLATTSQGVEGIGLCVRQ
jgi:hypothetical protein